MREQVLHSHIFSDNASLPGYITLPPGDDMAALRVPRDEILIAVDQVAAGIHFDPASATLKQIARKALTRNLSDIAAMGARPLAAVSAAALPRSMSDADASTLFDAMRQVSLAFGCPLIGGDIAAWDQPMLLSITVLAACAANVKPITRSGAKPGDVVVVSGTLGGSLETIDGYTHHQDFEPRLTLGQALAASDRFRPTAMIDLSDGLGRDAARLCQQSNVAIDLEAAAVPVSAAARQAAAKSGRPALQHAVQDGEDYELCFTLSPDAAAALPAHIEGIPLTRIGHVLPARDGGHVRLVQPDGTWQPLDSVGWEHEA